MRPHRAVSLEAQSVCTVLDLANIAERTQPHPLGQLNTWETANTGRSSACSSPAPRIRHGL